MHGESQPKKFELQLSSRCQGPQTSCLFSQLLNWLLSMHMQLFFQVSCACQHKDAVDYMILINLSIYEHFICKRYIFFSCTTPIMEKPKLLASEQKCSDMGNSRVSGYTLRTTDGCCRPFACRKVNRCSCGYQENCCSQSCQPFSNKYFSLGSLRVNPLLGFANFSGIH